MTDQLFNVEAVNIKTRERRIMVERITRLNAEAFVKMAIYRRGVDEEFYAVVPCELVSKEIKP